MSYALASRIERAVKNAGVEYKKVSGWASRGHGTMGSITSVVCHHTAGPASGNSPSLNVVAYGRPGLSGPLSQLFLARDGTVYLVAAGVSYHAGRVKSSLYSNSHAIGIEAEATGVTSWPDHQIDAYAKLCKALIKEFGLSTSRVVGHKEACSPSGRKIDPNFSMSDFRAKVGGAKGGVSSGGGSTGGSGGGKYESATAKHEVGSRVMGLYDGGTDVNWLQRRLPKVGYSAGSVDGYFGPSVEKAVRKFQKAAGVDVDGLVGKDTLAKLRAADEVAEAPKPKPSTPKAPKFPLPSGHYFGSKSGPDESHSGYYNNREHLRAWQKQMRKRGWTLKADGLYGSRTKAVALNFQKEKGLDRDGLIGAETWAAAWTEPVT